VLLELFLFLLAVWICSSILTAFAIRSERYRIAHELYKLQEAARKQRVDSLYGREHDEVDP